MTQPHVPDPQDAHPSRRPRSGIIVFLVCISLLLLLLTGLLIQDIARSTQQQASPANSAPTPVPLDIPGQANISPLSLPEGQQVIYEQSGGLYLLTVNGKDKPRLLSTPGYSYNYALPPLLVPGGKLLYSGNGLWLMDLSSGATKQIASLEQGQVITSMVVSQDGKRIAWSSAPKVWPGTISLYAGSLEKSSLIYQRSTAACPCLRVFSLLEQAAGKTTLLLTDDRGDQRAIRYGLWALDISGTAGEPRRLLEENPPQTPLALDVASSTLLYANSGGVVPVPLDGSVPNEATTLWYANSLSLATIEGVSPTLSTPQVLVAGQRQLSNTAEYHWITTPLLSPDGRTLAYVEFSSDEHPPFGRHSALYLARIEHGDQQSAPQLLATSKAGFVELGAWLNPYVITFYANRTLYAMDVQTGAVLKLVQTPGFARVVGTLVQG